MSVTVLVTAAGSAPAQAFVRGVRDQDEVEMRVVGVDGVQHSSGLFECDARYTVPRVDDPDYIGAIATICRAEGVDVVAPILDEELDLFAAEAPRLLEETGARVITNSPAAVALMRDKRLSADAVERAGVAAPAFYEPGDAAAHLPVIVKPRHGAGSVGVSVARTPAQLEEALAASRDGALVQQLIEGDEYTVDLVLDPSGEVLAVAPRVRVEVRGGQSYKGRTVDDPDVEQASRACAAALGMTGQGNVQLMKSREDGRCYFIEANPKFAAAMGLTVGAGLNIPLLYVKLALGLEIDPAQLVRRADMWLLRSWRDRCVPAEDIAAVRPWSAAGQA